MDPAPGAYGAPKKTKNPSKLEISINKKGSSGSATPSKTSNSSTILKGRTSEDSSSKDQKKASSAEKKRAPPSPPPKKKVSSPKTSPLGPKYPRKSEIHTSVVVYVPVDTDNRSKSVSFSEIADPPKKYQGGEAPADDALVGGEPKNQGKNLSPRKQAETKNTHSESGDDEGNDPLAGTAAYQDIPEPSSASGDDEGVLSGDDGEDVEGGAVMSDSDGNEAPQTTMRRGKRKKKAYRSNTASSSSRVAATVIEVTTEAPKKIMSRIDRILFQERVQDREVQRVTKTTSRMAELKYFSNTAHVVNMDGEEGPSALLGNEGDLGASFLGASNRDALAASNISYFCQSGRGRPEGWGSPNRAGSPLRDKDRSSPPRATLSPSPSMSPTPTPTPGTLTRGRVEPRKAQEVEGGTQVGGISLKPHPATLAIQKAKAQKREEILARRPESQQKQQHSGGSTPPSATPLATPSKVDIQVTPLPASGIKGTKSAKTPQLLAGQQSPSIAGASALSSPGRGFMQQPPNSGTQPLRPTAASTTDLPDLFTQGLSTKPIDQLDHPDTAKILKKHETDLSAMRRYVEVNGYEEEQIAFEDTRLKHQTEHQRKADYSQTPWVEHSVLDPTCKKTRVGFRGEAETQQVAATGKKLPWVGTAPPQVSDLSRGYVHSQQDKATARTVEIQPIFRSHGAVSTTEIKKGMAHFGKGGTGVGGLPPQQRIISKIDDAARYTDIEGNVKIRNFAPVRATISVSEVHKEAQDKRDAKRAIQIGNDSLSDGFGTQSWTEVGKSLTMQALKYSEWREKFGTSQMTNAGGGAGKGGVPIFHWIPMLETALNDVTIDRGAERLPWLLDQGEDLEPPTELSDPLNAHNDFSDGATVRRYKTVVTAGGELQQKRVGKNDFRAKHTDISKRKPMRPHPLRIATALFAVHELFHHFQLPFSLFEDILSAVYLDGQGATTVSSKNEQSLDAAKMAASRQERHRVETDFFSRTLFVTALNRKNQLFDVLNKKSAEVTAEATRVQNELNLAKKQRKFKELRISFSGWKSITFTQGAWRHAARKHHVHRHDTLLKAKAFRSWKTYMSMSQLDRDKEELEGQVYSMEESLNAQLHQLKDQGQLRERLRSLGADPDDDDFDPTGGRGRRFHGGVGKYAQMTMEELDAMEQNAQRAQTLEYEVASLSRRVKDLEAKARVALMEKERQKDRANLATEAVAEVLSGLVNHRLRTGVKASDVVVNAEKISSGALTTFHRTSVTGVDAVVAPVRCKGDHILLAWANGVIEQATGTFPKIGHISHALTDGRHYAILVKEIFPESGLGARMLEVPESDALKRLHLLVTEGSVLLAQRNRSAPGTASGGPSSTPSSKRRQSSRAGASNRDTQGPLLDMGITPHDLHLGKEDSHFVVLFSLFKCYSGRQMIKLTEEGSQSDDPAVVQKVLTGQMVVVNNEEQDELEMPAETLVLRLQLASRSLASWILLGQKVEDTATQVMYRLANGQRAKAYFTDTQQDAVLSKFTLDPSSVTGGEETDELENTVNSETSGGGGRRRSSVSGLLATLHGEDSTHEASVLEQENERAEVDISLKKKVTNTLCSMVTQLPQRQELINTISLAAETMSCVFENYSDRRPCLTLQRFEECLKDCCVYQGNHLLAGAGDRIARRFATPPLEILGDTTKEKDAVAALSPYAHTPKSNNLVLHPIEFAGAIVSVADELIKTLSQVGKRKASTASGLEDSGISMSLDSAITDSLLAAAAGTKTCADRVSVFLTHFVLRNLRLVSSGNVRKLLQDSSVVSVLDVNRPALRQLFAAIAQSGKKSPDTDGGTSTELDSSLLSLTQQEWIKWARLLEMIDTWTSQKEMEQIFTNCQDVFDVTSDDEMSFDEFQEALVGLSQFRCPNPYLSPGTRFKYFLNSKLLPAVKKKMPSLYPRLVLAMKSSSMGNTRE